MIELDLNALVTGINKPWGGEFVKLEESFEFFVSGFESESSWANVKLQKLCFLEVLGNEMVRNGVKIVAKSDGGIAGFVDKYQYWQLAAGKGEAAGRFLVPSF